MEVCSRDSPAVTGGTCCWVDGSLLRDPRCQCCRESPSHSLLPCVPFTQRLLSGLILTLPGLGPLCDATKTMSWSKRRREAHMCQDVMGLGGLEYSAGLGSAGHEKHSLIFILQQASFQKGGCGEVLGRRTGALTGKVQGRAQSPGSTPSWSSRICTATTNAFNLSVPTSYRFKQQWRHWPQHHKA